MMDGQPGVAGAPKARERKVCTKVKEVDRGQARQETARAGEYESYSEVMRND